MSRICTLAAALILIGACATPYSPATDGRVSVIDLRLYPSQYEDQSVIAYGFLKSVDESSAALYFDDRHIARQATRLVVPVTLIGSAPQARAQSCDGKEVLLKGTWQQTDQGWALATDSDFVC